MKIRIVQKEKKKKFWIPRSSKIFVTQQSTNGIFKRNSFISSTIEKKEKKEKQIKQDHFVPIILCDNEC